MKAGGGGSGGESAGLIVQVSNPAPPSYLLGGNGVGRGSRGGSLRGRHRGLPLSPPSPAPTSTGTIRFLPARNISNIARPLPIPQHRITASSPQKKMQEPDEYADSIVDSKPKIYKQVPLIYHWGMAVSRSTYGEIRSVMQDHNYCAQLPTPAVGVLSAGVVTPVKPNGSVTQYPPNGYQQQPVIQRHHQHQSPQHQSVTPQQSLLIHHGMIGSGGRVVSPQNYTRPSSLPVSGSMPTTPGSLSNQADPELSSDDDRDRPTGGSDGEETETANEDEDNSVTRCICDFQHDDGYMICCDKCLVWQHVDCMGIERGNIPDEYRCEECEPRRVDKARAVRLQLNKRAQFKDLTPEPQPSTTPTHHHHPTPQPPPTVRNTVRKRTTSHSSVNKKKEKMTKTPTTPTNRWRSESKTKQQHQQQKKPVKKQRFKSTTRKNSTSAKGGSDSDRSLSSPVDNHNNNSTLSVNHNSNSAAAVAQLRQWIDSYEEAVTNHYSPELRARVAALKLNGVHNPPAIDLTKLQIPPVPKYRISLMPSGIKIVQSTGSIPSGQVVVEVRGKFMLAKGRGGVGGPSPGPYVFYHRVSTEASTEICVDARTYGNDARFIRRSCQPNSELRHCIEKGAVHLYIISTRSIENKTEITLPLSIGHFCVCNGSKCNHDAHSGQSNPNSQINYSMDKRRRGRRRTLSETSAPGNAVPAQQPSPTVPVQEVKSLPQQQQQQMTAVNLSVAPPPPPVLPSVTATTKEKSPEVEPKEATVPPPPPPPLPPPPVPPPPPVQVTTTPNNNKNTIIPKRENLVTLESPPLKKKAISPARERESKEVKSEVTTPTSREEKKKVKRSLSVVQGKTAGSLLAGAVTTRRATTPSARTEEKRLRNHNGEPLPKDNSKMTREERKMEAIMKAFERLEKDEQRKQQQHTGTTTPQIIEPKRIREPIQRKSNSESPQKTPRTKSTNRRDTRVSKVALRTRGRVNRTQSRARGKPAKAPKKQGRNRSPLISSAEDSSDDEVVSPRRPPVQRRRRPPSSASSAASTPSPRHRKQLVPPPPKDEDEEDDREEEFEEEEEHTLPDVTPPSTDTTPPQLSNTCLLVAAAVGPLAPGFKFPKTKKNMLNSWLVGEGGSTSPLQNESPSDLPPTLENAVTPTDQPIDQQLNDPQGDASQTELAAPEQPTDHCTAKKRWLRQAISEDSDSPRPECSGSPVEMAAPLKKRRVARESVSSDTAFTPPTTPSAEPPAQIFEDEMVDENSSGSSPAVDNECTTPNENLQLPTVTNNENENENVGNRTPKLFESPRSEDSKPQSPDTNAVVPTAPEIIPEDGKSCDKSPGDDSELPPMQMLSDDPESQLAAMEDDSGGTNAEPAVKSAEEISKEHADAVELLNQLTTDEPAGQNPESEAEQPTTPKQPIQVTEEKEASKIKRKLSISEYRERVKSYPPKQKKPSSDEEGTPNDKKSNYNSREDSDSDESSSEINTLLAKIDTSHIDLAFPTQPFKKVSGGFSAEPTLVEKQREALTDRLKREFGLFLSDDEDHDIKFKVGSTASSASGLQITIDNKMAELIGMGNIGGAGVSPNSTVRHLRDRRTRRPPPPPPAGPPPPVSATTLPPNLSVPPPVVPAAPISAPAPPLSMPPGGVVMNTGVAPVTSGPPPVSWPYFPAAPPPPPPPHHAPPPTHHPPPHHYHMRH